MRFACYKFDMLQRFALQAILHLSIQFSISSSIDRALMSYVIFSLFGLFLLILSYPFDLHLIHLYLDISILIPYSCHKGQIHGLHLYLDIINPFMNNTSLRD